MSLEQTLGLVEVAKPKPKPRVEPKKRQRDAIESRRDEKRQERVAKKQRDKVVIKNYGRRRC